MKSDKLGQSHKHSLYESFLNVFVGYIIGLTSQILIFPFYGINISILDNLTMGLFFTVISIVRSYILRRYFNKKDIQRIKRMI